MKQLIEFDGQLMTETELRRKADDVNFWMEKCRSLLIQKGNLESENQELKNDCIRLASEIQYIGASDKELMYPDLYKSYLKGTSKENNP